MCISELVWMWLSQCLICCPDVKKNSKFDAIHCSHMYSLAFRNLKRRLNLPSSENVEATWVLGVVVIRKIVST